MEVQIRIYRRDDKLGNTGVHFLGDKFNYTMWCVGCPLHGLQFNNRVSQLLRRRIERKRYKSVEHAGGYTCVCACMSVYVCVCVRAESVVAIFMSPTLKCRKNDWVMWVIALPVFFLEHHQRQAIGPRAVWIHRPCAAS